MLKKIITQIRWLYYRLIVKFIKKRIVASKTGTPFIIGTNTSHEYHRAVTFYDKEPEMLDWLDKLLSYKGKDFVFWDVGANIGIYSLYTAKKYSEAKIFCFEPEANNFNALCNNIHLNEFKNVYPFMLGLSDSSGFDELQISVMASGAGASSVGSPYKYISSGTIFKQGIYKSSFNDLIKNASFPIPNFIKIDVDGHEQQILKGADQLFEMEGLLAVMIELEYKDSDDLNCTIDYFKKFGFVVSKVSEWKEFSNDSVNQNFLFERK